MASLKLPKARVMVTRASMWKRVIAFIIDLLIIDLLFFPQFKKFIITGSWTFEQVVQQQIILPVGFTMAIIAMGTLTLLYFSLYQYYFGETIGMRLFGIKVGGERTYWRCVLRNLYSLPFFPFTIFWIVDPIYLFWRKERLLEKWSKTSTIEITRM